MMDYSRVIAVTNRHICTGPFLSQIERVCSLGPAALILREKDLDEREYLELAARVQDICLGHDVKFIPHFYPEAAISLGIPRIHLPLWKLEKLSRDSGEAGIFSVDYFEEIGVSVHSPEEAIRARELGAAYLIAGHIFHTQCKAGLEPRGLKFLEEVCSAVDIPVCAIGGMDGDEGRVDAAFLRGAAAVCFMSGMMKI